MITSFGSFEKLEFSCEDDDDDDSFCFSTPPLDHKKYTYLIVEVRAKVFGPGELSTQPSSSSPDKKLL